LFIGGWRESKLFVAAIQLNWSRACKFK